MAEFGNMLYNYAHGDDQYRDRFVDHLGALREEGVNTWHDRIARRPRLLLG